MNNKQLDMVLGYLNEGTEINEIEFMMESINETINQFEFVNEDVEILNEGKIGDMIKTIISKIVEFIKKFVSAIGNFISAIINKITGASTKKEIEDTCTKMKNTPVEELNKNMKENEEKIKEEMKKANESINNSINNIVNRHKETNEYIKKVLDEINNSAFDSKVKDLNKDLGISGDSEPIDVEYKEIGEAVYNLSKISDSDIKNLVFVEVNIDDSFDKFISDYDQLYVHGNDEIEINVDKYLKISDNAITVKKLSMSTPIPAVKFENYIKTYANRLRIAQKNMNKLEKEAHMAKYSRDGYDHGDSEVGRRLYNRYNKCYGIVTNMCRLYKDYIDILKTALITAHGNIKILRKYVVE